MPTTRASIAAAVTGVDDATEEMDFEIDGEGRLTRRGTQDLMAAFRQLQLAVKSRVDDSARLESKLDKFEASAKKVFSDLSDKMDQLLSKVPSRPTSAPTPPPNAIFLSSNASCIHFGDSNSRTLPRHFRDMPGWTQLVHTTGLYEAIKKVPLLCFRGDSSAIELLHFSCFTNDITQNYPVEWFKLRCAELLTECKKTFPTAKVSFILPPPRNDDIELRCKNREVCMMLLESYPEEAVQVPEFVVDGELGTEADPTLLLSDGFHLSDRGISFLANAINSLAQVYLKKDGPLQRVPVFDAVAGQPRGGRGGRFFRGRGTWSYGAPNAWHDRGRLSRGGWRGRDAARPFVPHAGMGFRQDTGGHRGGDTRGELGLRDQLLAVLQNYNGGYSQ
jgi:hypothetical protein